MFWAGSPQACADLLHPDGVPPEAIIDLAFVDDCAMAIHSSTLHRVQDIVKAGRCGAMDAAAKGRGLLLNFAPGKTEVIPSSGWKGLGCCQGPIAGVFAAIDLGARLTAISASGCPLL